LKHWRIGVVEKGKKVYRYWKLLPLADDEISITHSIERKEMWKRRIRYPAYSLAYP